MSTIHDLRAWQSDTVQSRLYEAEDSADEGHPADRPAWKHGSAEIILFPKASLKALKRPRKKLMRRRAPKR